MSTTARQARHSRSQELHWHRAGECNCSFDVCGAKSERRRVTCRDLLSYRYKFSEEPFESLCLNLAIIRVASYRAIAEYQPI